MNTVLMKSANDDAFQQVLLVRSDTAESFAPLAGKRVLIIQSIKCCSALMLMQPDLHCSHAPFLAMGER